MSFEKASVAQFHPHDWKILHQSVVLALIVHITAGLAMAAVLGRGLDTNPDLQNRLSFIANNSFLWAGGWLLWNVAAISIINFFVAFARAHRGTGQGHWLTLCVAIAAAAIACDLASESVETGLIPTLARNAIQAGSANDTSLNLYVIIHRMVVLLTGYVANGLYTIATALAVFAGRKHYPRWVSLAGSAVTIFGVAESTACMVDSPQGILCSHAVLIPCFVIWQFGIALDSRKQAKRQTLGPPSTN